jgi:hypothetical protein
MAPTLCPSGHLGLAALDNLAHVEALELRMPEIEGLVVAGVAMRGAERLGLGPGFEGRAALPDGMGRIKRVILGFGAFKKVELDETRHLVETTAFFMGEPRSR